MTSYKHRLTHPDIQAFIGTAGIALPNSVRILYSQPILLMSTPGLFAPDFPVQFFEPINEPLVCDPNGRKFLRFATGLDSEGYLAELTDDSERTPLWIQWYDRDAFDLEHVELTLELLLKRPWKPVDTDRTFYFDNP